MKPEDNKTTNDRHLDADLNSIEQEYRRAHADEPPGMLDQAVLNKARLAAEVKGTGWHFGGFRWISAFATASVVVVSLALVVEQTIRKPLPRDLPVTPSSRTESYEIDVLSAGDANELLQAVEESPTDSLDRLEFRARRAPVPERKIEQPDRQNGVDGLQHREIQAAAAISSSGPETQQRRNDALQMKQRPGDQKAAVGSLDKTDTDAAAEPTLSDILNIAAEPLLESELDSVMVSGAAGMPDPPPPEVWIRRIMRWKNLQLNEKFEREFAQFRKVYPDYELPEVLARIVREADREND